MMERLKERREKKVCLQQKDGLLRQEGRRYGHECFSVHRWQTTHCMMGEEEDGTGFKLRWLAAGKR